MLRPGLARLGHSLRTFQRSLHNVPPLPHNFEGGIPEFLSPAAFDISWTQYQRLMVDKLNQLTVGMCTQLGVNLLLEMVRHFIPFINAP